MGCLSLAGLVGFVLILGMICSCEAYNFIVGGKDGWVLNPSEAFNHWAERNRFQVNDTLYFKYKNETDSVLVVSKEDYLSCNTKNPVISLKNGESFFKFGHSGPFYFISGNGDACQKGQKLIVVVLALTHHQQQRRPPPPTSSPPPQSPAPAPQSPESDVGIKTPAPAPAKNSAFGSQTITFGLGFGIIINIGVLILSSNLVV